MDISSLRERSRGALTVTELNGYIKNIFENDRTLTSVSIRGEISNFVNHKNGHLYFSLKDEDSQIRAVMFRSSAQSLKFAPENGMKVVVHGSVSVYQRDGTYQVYVRKIEPDGIGALYLAFEQLKEKLRQEGLFDIQNKKSIPIFPERVGVITSPTGAAVRDIINVCKRRCPSADIYLYPSLVQGDGAVENLVSALDYFDKTKLVDVIIIGRGGGSIEDLWAFNSEILARKIHSVSIPIISAVGHETDFTICDFVADLRAPTPSAAAELSVPDTREIMLRLDALRERLALSLVRQVENKREALCRISEKDVLQSPELIIKQRRELLSDYYNSIITDINSLIKEKRTDMIINSEKLNALNPLLVIGRGYSLTEREGEIIKSVKNLTRGDRVDIRLSDGSVTALVENINNER